MHEKTARPWPAAGPLESNVWYLAPPEGMDLNGVRVVCIRVRGSDIDVDHGDQVWSFSNVQLKPTWGISHDA